MLFIVINVNPNQLTHCDIVVSLYGPTLDIVDGNCVGLASAVAVRDYKQPGHMRPGQKSWAGDLRLDGGNIEKWQGHAHIF